MKPVSPPKAHSSGGLEPSEPQKTEPLSPQRVTPKQQKNEESVCLPRTGPKNLLQRRPSTVQNKSLDAPSIGKPRSIMGDLTENESLRAIVKGHERSPPRTPQEPRPRAAHPPDSPPAGNRRLKANLKEKTFLHFPNDPPYQHPHHPPYHPARRFRFRSIDNSLSPRRQDAKFVPKPRDRSIELAKKFVVLPPPLTKNGPDGCRWEDAYKKQESCILFTKLPREIRDLIYEHLLVSPEIITPKLQRLGDDNDGLVGGWPRKPLHVMQANHHPTKPVSGFGYKPQSGLDATLPRTCRAVYKEGYTILYKDNVFHFDSLADIIKFQRDGVPYIDSLRRAIGCWGVFGRSKFGLGPVDREDGRLSSIRHVSFSNRTHILGLSWGGDMREFSCVSRGIGAHRFPSLESLHLDIGGFEFNDRDIDTILHLTFSIESYGPRKTDGSAVGLRSLTLKGLSDQRLLGPLQGLLRPGGSLCLDTKSPSSET